MCTTGTVVAQVKLVAPMLVQYRLLGDLSQFSVDTEGVVRVTAPLDRETTPSLTLGLLASRPPLSGFTELYVSVVDVNDCPPRFLGAEYSVSVAENIPEGTPIVRGKSFLNCLSQTKFHHILHILVCIKEES